MWRRIVGELDGQSLSSLLFAGGTHSPAFRQTRRALFDRLYLLYMLRRVTAIDLGPVMSALRALHVMEAMAVDELIDRALDGKLDADGRTVLNGLTERFPPLKGWDQHRPRKSLPLLTDIHALQRYWRATPIVHPIFARLFWYRNPFNDLKPIGVGDLKVVKQRLLGYQAGEISDIHNVMLGESKVREHRRLEKTEERFSFSSGSEQERSTDTQSADRFEVKKEAERIVKTEVAASAGTSVSYQQMPVIATVNANVALNYSDTRMDKSAHNFSREVIGKAVSRIASRTASERSTTKIFETEERNAHTFDNKAGPSHISGIYRWVDKRYEAQVYNYGRRLMFEFIVPEPAAFLVEQRLRAFEANLVLPNKPDEPTVKQVELGFTAAQIDAALLLRLRRDYGIDDEYPASRRVVNLINPETGQDFFANEKITTPKVFVPSTHDCAVQAAGYRVAGLELTGHVNFNGPANPNHESQRNLLYILVDGETVVQIDKSGIGYVGFEVPDTNVPGNLTHYNNGTVQLMARPVLGPEKMRLQLLTQNATDFGLHISLVLDFPPESLARWQESVHRKVWEIEKKRVEAENLEARLAYESGMTTFRNRLDDIRATAINELLQGTSEADNRAMILQELKRCCLAMLTRDFDDYDLDDSLTRWETMGVLTTPMRQTRMKVSDEPSAEFETKPVDASFPAVRHAAAIDKGRFIQFLEQAFEWQQLGWAAYPYFWATPPKWVELMDRRDDADPGLTAFLRAGAAKVLLAVAPNYDEAVIHFLATREPWLGGDAPVLGDPLYIPLHEEMRRAQDDRYGGVPEGEPWEFIVPTTLVYLHGSRDQLPAMNSES